MSTSYALDRTSERASFALSQIDVDARRRSLKLTEYNVVNEVRAAARSVQRVGKSIVLQEQNIDFAEKADAARDPSLPARACQQLRHHRRREQPHTGTQQLRFVGDGLSRRSDTVKACERHPSTSTRNSPRVIFCRARDIIHERDNESTSGVGPRAVAPELALDLVPDGYRAVDEGKPETPAPDRRGSCDRRVCGRVAVALADERRDASRGGRGRSVRSRDRRKRHAPGAPLGDLLLGDTGKPGKDFGDRARGNARERRRRARRIRLSAVRGRAGAIASAARASGGGAREGARGVQAPSNRRQRRAHRNARQGASSGARARKRRRREGQSSRKRNRKRSYRKPAASSKKPKPATKT